METHRERQKGVSKKTLRYGHADLISYTFNVVEDIEIYEPRNYKEACMNSDNKKKCFHCYERRTRHFA